MRDVVLNVQFKYRLECFSDVLYLYKTEYINFSQISASFHKFKEDLGYEILNGIIVVDTATFIRC